MEKIETIETFEQKTIEQMETLFPVTRATCPNCLESIADIMTKFRKEKLEHARNYYALIEKNIANPNLETRDIIITETETADLSVYKRGRKILRHDVVCTCGRECRIELNYSTGELKGQCFILKSRLFRPKKDIVEQQKSNENNVPLQAQEVKPVKQQDFGEQFIFIRRYPHGYQTKQTIS